MKKIFAFLAALLAIVTNQPLHARQNKSENENKSLLWRISGNHLTKPSYLFGTIHLICADDFIWTDKMKQSLGNSDKICFEMDLDDPSVMMEVANGLMDHSGKQLKDYFTPEQYKLLQNYFRDSIGMDLTGLQQLKPAALQTMMSTSSAGCSNPISYEDSIMQIAKNDKKEIIGLESPKEQIAVLESIPVDTVIRQILEEVQGNNKDNDDAEYGQLIAAYKKQDLPELYTLVTSSKDVGGGMDKFLDDRNKKWIVRMPVSMKQSSVFFAVGAGHLWGTNGVITLLRKAGYTVEPIK